MEVTKARRGFAAMDPEKLRHVSAKGGASVPPDKRSFSISPELAANAGRIGGAAGRGVDRISRLDGGDRKGGRRVSAEGSNQ